MSVSTHPSCRGDKGCCWGGEGRKWERRGRCRGGGDHFLVRIAYGTHPHKPAQLATVGPNRLTVPPLVLFLFPSFPVGCSSRSCVLGCCSGCWLHSRQQTTLCPCPFLNIVWYSCQRFHFILWPSSAMNMSALWSVIIWSLCFVWLLHVAANVEVREYQRYIVQKALFTNTLVALPTGLGKTFIAAVVMYNYFRWFPEGNNLVSNWTLHLLCCISWTFAEGACWQIAVTDILNSSGKIVFTAPSRPLVTQQIEACHNTVGIPQVLKFISFGIHACLVSDKDWHIFSASAGD